MVERVEPLREMHKLFSRLKDDDALLMHNLCEDYKLCVKKELNFWKNAYITITTEFGAPVIDVINARDQKPKKPYLVRFYIDSEKWFPQIGKKFRSKYKPRRISEKDLVEELVEIQLWFKTQDEVVQLIRESLVEAV